MFWIKVLNDTFRCQQFCHTFNIYLYIYLPCVTSQGVYTRVKPKQSNQQKNKQTSVSWFHYISPFFNKKVVYHEHSHTLFLLKTGDEVQHMFLVEVYLVGDYTEPKHKDRFRVQPPPRTTLHYPRTPPKGRTTIRALSLTQKDSRPANCHTPGRGQDEERKDEVSTSCGRGGSGKQY